MSKIIDPTQIISAILAICVTVTSRTLGDTLSRRQQTRRTQKQQHKKEEDHHE